MQIKNILFFTFLDNAKKLQFRQFETMVKEFGPDNADRSIAFKYAGLRPTSDSRILTVPQTKKYKTVNQKGIIDSDFNVWPFGCF